MSMGSAGDLDRRDVLDGCSRDQEMKLACESRQDGTLDVEVPYLHVKAEGPSFRPLASAARTLTRRQPTRLFHRIGTN